MGTPAEPPFHPSMFIVQPPAEQASDAEDGEESQPEAPSQPEVESREYFLEPPPEGTYESQEILLASVRKHAVSKGYTITIQRSKPNISLYIGCDRGGHQRLGAKTLASPGVKRRHKQSRKCGCPFQVYCKKNYKQTTWDLTIRNPVHNHPAEEDMTVHPSARRLTPEQRRHIKHLDMIGVKPKDILTFLKLESPRALLIPRDIYNEVSRWKKREKDAQEPLSTQQNDTPQQVLPQEVPSQHALLQPVPFQQALSPQVPPQQPLSGGQVGPLVSHT
ncbi:hypothetical protein N7490_003716 [Penicillium lividum]|nr:hypothetical protein N7490_003716 [Penicillium lividum]